jgi:hypothetical protein
MTGGCSPTRRGHVMSRDEVPPSSHAADQAWFSMLLVNDPNTALVGSLRPSQQPPLWAALLRPFQTQPPLPAPEADWTMEQGLGLRSRPTGWVKTGLLLALGVGLAGLGSERVRVAAADTYAALQDEQHVSAPPSAAPPSAPQLVNAVGNSTEPASGTRVAAEALAAAPALSANIAPHAQARQDASAVLPRAAQAVEPSASAKKKPAAQPLRREFGRALTGRHSHESSGPRRARRR